MLILAPKKFKSKKNNAGFTLMEIMVATVVFVVVAVALLALFNYVLKINRRADALRQASQDSRNFVEFLVKEIRNGQVDYFVNAGLKYGNYINGDSPQAPCRPPRSPGVDVDSTPTYQSKSNWLGIINTDNVEECFYLANPDGSYVNSIGQTNSLTYTAPAGTTLNLNMMKDGIGLPQTLNPPNARIESLTFLVRPQLDPYSSPAPGGPPNIQPAVVVLVKFVVQLPTGETVPIYYQSSVSENKYDIP